MMRRSWLFPFALTLCALLIFASHVIARGEWDDPPDGWDGMYEFDDLKDWVHNNGSDQWDESAPGEEGTSPGGAHIVEIPGKGDPSGNAVVISIEDTGDPRNAGFADPGSNRKIYMENEVDFNGNFYIDGITFIARWRINPDPIEAPADGTDLHDGAKGQVGIVHGDAPGNFSFALDTGGLLYFGSEAQQPLEVGDEFQFHTVWATAMLTGGGVYDVEIYLDGSTDPAFSDEMVLGTGSDGDIYPNYVTVGLGSTGRDGAIQVDYIGYELGVHTPIPFAVNPAGKLPHLWGRLKAR